jgi:hypothetical protein
VTGEKALFKEKHKYKFAAFERTLQTDQGKAHVREFEKESDTQSIYRCICERALKSAKAAILASNILTYIASYKFGEAGEKERTRKRRPFTFQGLDRNRQPLIRRIL